ncbi:hypothetical protein ACFV3R_32870 [Streptomyces sp. NPDC059740]|uniref:hypothetical protein n=1 Tax=Streptomyces sp. NPDC059740 TaxID=3346926 RepID=UPI00366A09A2
MQRIGASHLLLQPDALAHRATAQVMDKVASFPVRPSKPKRDSARWARKALVSASDSPTEVSS